MYYFVDVVAGYDQSFGQMSLLLGFCQVMACAAQHHLAAMIDECLKDFLQAKRLGSSVHQRHIVHAERRLQCSHLEQLVKHDLGIGLTLDIDHDIDLASGRGIRHVGDAVDLLLVGQFGYILYKFRLDYTVRNLGYNDGIVVVVRLYLGLGSDHDTASSCLVGVANTLQAVYLAACGEIRSLDIFHQSVKINVGIVYQRYGCIQRLGQVVGRHICGHTHGDTRCTIHQQVRNSGGQHGGFEQRIVEVGDEIDRFLVQVTQHFLAHTRQLHLRVTHGGRGVSVD